MVDENEIVSGKGAVTRSMVLPVALGTPVVYAFLWKCGNKLIRWKGKYIDLESSIWKFAKGDRSLYTLHTGRRTLSAKQKKYEMWNRAKTDAVERANVKQRMRPVDNHDKPCRRLIFLCINKDGYCVLIIKYHLAKKMTKINYIRPCVFIF